MPIRTLVRFFIFSTLALSFIVRSCPAGAESFYSEVINVDGDAFMSNDAVKKSPLKIGDHLKEKDVVEVGPASFVDLAYDKNHWNMTRIEKRTRSR